MHKIRRIDACGEKKRNKYPTGIRLEMILLARGRGGPYIKSRRIKNGGTRRSRNERYYTNSDDRPSPHDLSSPIVLRPNVYPAYIIYTYMIIPTRRALTPRVVPTTPPNRLYFRSTHELFRRLFRSTFRRRPRRFAIASSRLQR